MSIRPGFTCLLIFSFAIVIFRPVYAQVQPPPERTIRLSHYSATLSFDPVTGTLDGQAVYRFTPLRKSADSVVFYAPGMEIREVSLLTPNEKTVTTSFKKMADNLIVYLPGNMGDYTGKDGISQMRILYHAKDPAELHRTGWDDPFGRMRKQVWAHRPFGWIPFLDQMTTQDIYITFDKHYQVVSNGERISKTPSGDTAFTWHYRLSKPHPFYSVCLVAGDYEYRNLTTKNGLPLELWYYPDLKDRFDLTYAYQKEMFDFFEEETGMTYPYTLYRNIPVADYLYGAMETTTSTVYADFMQVDARGFFGRNYINTNAHELAHQWFGNCINDLTVNDLWLTESFATYYAKIFERKYLGENAYEYQRDQEFQKALKAAENNSYALGSGQAGVERWYQKGSLVMDMLRDVLGDEAFLSSIKRYMTTHAYHEAKSTDFLDAIYQSCGMAVNWFFEDWIYHGGEPEYQVSWKSNFDSLGQEVVALTVEQVQPLSRPEDLFRMPVMLEVYYDDGSMASKKVWIEKQSHLVEIPSGKGRKASFLVFDAGRRILKKMRYERTSAMLKAQLLRANHVADRLEAARALRSFSPEQKRDVLRQSFSKETFHPLKSEIITQLAEDSLSRDLIGKAIRDKEAMVRRAVTESIKKVPQELLADYESLLKDSSYITVENAFINLVRTVEDASYLLPEQRKTKVNSYLELLQHETGWRGRNLRTAWLGVALEQDPSNQTLLRELIDYTRASFDFETRLNALNQLKKLNYLDEESAGLLVKASQYWNYKLANPAKEMIQYFSQQEKYRHLLP